MSKLLPHHLRVLRMLAEMTRPDGELCVSFSRFAQRPGVERTEIRRVTRSLARKGLAEYHRGLITESGDLAGSGYCISRAGLAYLAECGGAR